MKNVRLFITRALPHFVLFGLAATALYHIRDIRALGFSGDLHVYAFLAIGVGMLMSFHFQRSRSFLSLVLLAAAYGLVMQNAWFSGRILYFDSYARGFLSLMIPLNLVLISFSKESGFMTPKGIGKLAFILAQFGILAYLALMQEHRFLDLLYFEILPAGWTQFTALSDVALLMTLIAIFIITGRSLMAATHINFALLLTVVTAQMAINFTDRVDVFSLFILTASVMITLSMLSESYYLAYYDELTGIPARRALLSHFAKLGRRYSIAMVDIDHFKNFNDTHGHDVGDDVLKLVASRLTEVTGGGKAYRYGGEEFTVVFAGTSKEEAAQHLDAIREKIAQTPYYKPAKSKTKKADKPIFVNVSIGVAERDDKASEPSTVMKRADDALYKSKKAGRNRVTVA